MSTDSEDKVSQVGHEHTPLQQECEFISALIEVRSERNRGPPVFSLARP